MLRKALLNITFKLRKTWMERWRAKNKQTETKIWYLSKNLRKEEVVVAGVSKMWHEDWRDKKVSSLEGPEDQSKWRDLHLCKRILVTAKWSKCGYWKPSWDFATFISKIMPLWSSRVVSGKVDGSEQYLEDNIIEPWWLCVKGSNYKYDSSFCTTR